MDTSAFWCGLWVITVALWAVRERYVAAAFGQLHRAIGDLEAQLWHALRRGAKFEREAGEYRRGLRVPVRTAQVDRDFCE